MFKQEFYLARKEENPQKQTNKLCGSRGRIKSICHVVCHQNTCYSNNLPGLHVLHVWCAARNVFHFSHPKIDVLLPLAVFGIHTPTTTRPPIITLYLSIFDEVNICRIVASKLNSTSFYRNTKLIYMISFIAVCIQTNFSVKHVIFGIIYWEKLMSLAEGNDQI